MTTPYFETKAKLVLAQNGADHNNFAPLAQWAQEHHQDRDRLAGVLVALDGTIAAETFRHAGSYYVDEYSTPIQMFGSVLGFAMPKIAEAVGAPVFHVKLWEVAEGSGRQAHTEAVRLGLDVPVMTRKPAQEPRPVFADPAPF